MLHLACRHVKPPWPSLAVVLKCSSKFALICQVWFNAWNIEMTPSKPATLGTQTLLYQAAQCMLMPQRDFLAAADFIELHTALTSDCDSCLLQSLCPVAHSKPAALCYQTLLS